MPDSYSSADTYTSPQMTQPDFDQLLQQASTIADTYLPQQQVCQRPRVYRVLFTQSDGDCASRAILLSFNQACSSITQAICRNIQKEIQPYVSRFTRDLILITFTLLSERPIQLRRYCGKLSGINKHIEFGFSQSSTLYRASRLPHLTIRV